MVQPLRSTKCFADKANTRSTCQIFITNNSTISTVGKEPDERFETALRVVEVSEQILCLPKC